MCFFFWNSHNPVKQNMHTHKLTRTHTHTHPPASPVYVLTSRRHHSLYCVHPASRPNELNVYLTLAAGKREAEVTNQSHPNTVRQRWAEDKRSNVLHMHLPARGRLESKSKREKKSCKNRHVTSTQRGGDRLFDLWIHS